eukprot:Rhum_TRINITY_DN2223_c0_g1::Rhum_TRINITY_DN2223_c0_g1_i1::g.6416::m.6416
MAFSAGIKLTGLDYIAPSQVCILPLKSKTADDEKAAAEAAAEAHPEAGLVGVQARGERAAAKKLEDKVKLELADCLACSGCVTTAETMLVQEQSLGRFYDMLAASGRYTRGDAEESRADAVRATLAGAEGADDAGQSAPAPEDAPPPPPAKKVFVVSLSPQAVASVAALYGLEAAAAHAMLRRFFQERLGVDEVVDLLWANSLCVQEVAGEVLALVKDKAVSGALPLVTSACPGLVCYAEKREGHLVDHLSRVQSAQSVFGKLLKTQYVDARNEAAELAGAAERISAADVCHVSVQPCYDKKLEASRREFRAPAGEGVAEGDEDRYTDLVIATHELQDLLRDVLCLADDAVFAASFAAAPGAPRLTPSLATQAEKDVFAQKCGSGDGDGCACFGASAGVERVGGCTQETTTDGAATPGLPAVLLEGSGGYCVGVMQAVAEAFKLPWRLTLEDFDAATAKRKLEATGGLDGLKVSKKRHNFDEFFLVVGGQVVFKAAVCNGFHHISNLTKTRRARDPEYLKYDFIELMACPEGCNNGGGQVKTVSQLNPTETNGALVSRVSKRFHELLDAAAAAEKPTEPSVLAALTRRSVYGRLGAGAPSDFFLTTFNKIQSQEDTASAAPTLSQMSW